MLKPRGKLEVSCQIKCVREQILLSGSQIICFIKYLNNRKYLKVFSLCTQLMPILMPTQWIILKKSAVKLPVIAETANITGTLIACEPMKPLHFYSGHHVSKLVKNLESQSYLMLKANHTLSGHVIKFYSYVIFYYLPGFTVSGF